MILQKYKIKNMKQDGGHRNEFNLKIPISFLIIVKTRVTKVELFPGTYIQKN